MGLHPKTDERMVYKFFATNCGKICDVQIVKDPHSGRSKGNGYVEFYEASSVLKAINFSGTPINGQPIRVQPVNMPRNLDVPEILGHGNIGAAPYAVRKSVYWAAKKECISSPKVCWTGFTPFW